MRSIPTIVTAPREIERLRADRHPEIFTPPPEWRDLDFRFDIGKAYGVKEPVKIEGRAIFGGKPVTIEVGPSRDGETYFGMNGDLTRITPESLEVGRNNIRVGSARVVEHAAALGPGMNFRGSWNLSQNSFPLLAEGLRPVFDAIRPHLVEVGPMASITVKHPLAILFPSGSYLMVEPDAGAGKLIVDHQFSHPKNSMGNQRVVVEVNGETFAHFGDARPPSYGIRMAAATFFLKTLGMTRVPFFGVDWTNAVFVETKGLLNSNPKFDGCGPNREPILHEVVDKLAPWAALKERFIGRITTHRTSHGDDVEAVKIIADFLR